MRLNECAAMRMADPSAMTHTPSPCSAWVLGLFTWFPLETNNLLESGRVILQGDADPSPSSVLIGVLTGALC